MELGILSIIGIIIYFGIAIDILQTTLSMQGGGWLTSRFSHFFWKCALYLAGKDGRSKMLSQVGFIHLISIVITWVVLLWSSFVLILYGNPGSIISSSTKLPADFWEIVYYSGFTLSTLGIGDFIANGDIWRILTTVYSYTGLILLTMSVTYFVPVLSACIDQRKLGISISTLGSTPQEIVINSWTGSDFSRLTSKADEMADSIIKYSQQHRAYPVLHYFHNNKPEHNVILQLTRLYEALIIISNKVSGDDRPEDQDLKPLVVAFSNYLQTISEVTHISLTNENPPAVEIREIIRKRILNISENENISGEEEKDRRFFKTLLEQDGWKWSDLDAKSS
jgi:hypothetical protein